MENTWPWGSLDFNRLNYLKWLLFENCAVKQKKKSFTNFVLHFYTKPASVSGGALILENPADVIANIDFQKT